MHIKKLAKYKDQNQRIYIALEWRCWVPSLLDVEEVLNVRLCWAKTSRPGPPNPASPCWTLLAWSASVNTALSVECISMINTYSLIKHLKSNCSTKEINKQYLPDFFYLKLKVLNLMVIDWNCPVDNWCRLNSKIT